MSEPAGLLLAAGSGTRFGANKLLVPVDDGVPMAVCAARTLYAALPRSAVVVQSEDAQLSQLLAHGGLEIVPCASAALGMGASLACGVAALHEASGWVVALADMPFVRQSTFAAIVGALRGGAAIAVPRYRGQRGHPVGFSREFREALLALNADIGGRDIISVNVERVTWIDVDDPGIVRDIDTPTDIKESRR